MKNYVFLLFVFVFSNARAQNIASLAGNWKFAADSLDVGEKEHWENKKFDGNIHLPGSTDEIGLGNHFPLFKSILGQRTPQDYPKDADFGMLTRIHKYIGVAWYQKEINISRTEANKTFFLNLERVMWRSKVFVDGKEIGKPIDFLSTPHLHALGSLAKGKHTLTVLIDNRLIFPIGALAHSYNPHMQTQWNGVVGKINLLSYSSVIIKNIRVFPSFKNKHVAVELDVESKLPQNSKIKVEYQLKEKQSGKLVAKESEVFEIGKKNIFKNEIKLKDVPQTWDEFSPFLYELITSVSYRGKSTEQKSVFGFRDLGVRCKKFIINGRKINYRNSHEGMFFGKTGYPAMDTQYWTKLFNVYKDHGFNAVRFHSACPPEAAFEAADSLGIYLQVEFFWMDGWMGYKDLIGEKNERLNNFVKNELTEAIDVYGNHPSMMLIAIGNELGGNFDIMGKWIAEAKKHDPRHLYAAGIAHNITKADEYVEYGGKGDILLHKGTDWNYSKNYTVANAHNYDKEFRRKNLPEFVHEAGQYVVHPLWSEKDNYTGVLKPLNFEYFKNLATSHGIDKQDAEFQKASGYINKIMYKAEIEATLRTPESAGYALLSMVDYPGQGEAFIGWVNPFYKNKNFITAKEFREYGTYTVPLLLFNKWVWEDGETFKGKIEVSNFGPKAIDDAKVNYAIKYKQEVIAKGVIETKQIVQGGLTQVGEFSTLLKSGDSGRELTVELNILGTDYKNEWKIWVFPKTDTIVTTKDIFITSNIKEAVGALKKGRKVLLAANKLGTQANTTYASFAPVFWSATWFAGQETAVSGAIVQNLNPALSLFPTENVLDWQWAEVCKNSRGFILNDLPKDYRPIIQPVNDYHFGNKLGSLFELNTKDGGKLLVCGYDIADTVTSIAAHQLKKSLISYMISEKFNPEREISESWLLKTFANLNVPMQKPKGYEAAIMYIKAGKNHEVLNTSAEWSKKIDGAFVGAGVDYKVDCSGVWAEEKGSYWYGKKMKIEITVETPNVMMLKVRFQDPNNRGRTGIIRCEDMPKVKLGKHVDGEWISFPVTKENCLDKKLVIDMVCTRGENLMISDLVLIKE